MTIRQLNEPDAELTSYERLRNQIAEQATVIAHWREWADFHVGVRLDDKVSRQLLDELIAKGRTK